MEFTPEQVKWLKNKLKKEGVGVRRTVPHGNRETYEIEFENGYRVESLFSENHEETKKKAMQNIEGFMMF